MNQFGVFIFQLKHLFCFADDGKSTFVVTWANHFINSVHETGKFLNEIEQYPIQFKDIQDDGVLFSQK